MRRDRSEPMNLFALVSALSLALDPVLTEQDRVLHDDTLVQAVTADLIRRLPRTPIDGRRPRVWPKNSCGLALVVSQEPAEPFSTVNRACTPFICS